MAIVKPYKLVQFLLRETGGPLPVGGSDVTFINYGDLGSNPATGATLIVNGITILPGKQLIITADDPDAVDETLYNYQWNTGTGNTKNAIYVRKMYNPARSK